MRRLVLPAALLAATSAALAQPVDPPSDPAVAEAATAAAAAAAGPVQVAAVPAIVVGGPSTVVAAPAIADPAPAAETIAPIDVRRRADAAAGRHFFGETALTQPAGAFVAEVRMPTAPAAAYNLRYGVSDRVELNLGGITFFELDGNGDSESAFGAGAKVQVWSNGQAALALGANVYTAEGDTLYLPYASGSLCVGDDCYGLLTASATGLVLSEENAVPILGGLGLAVGKGAQFIAEVHQAHDGDGDSFTMGFVGGRGVGRTLSFDAGLAFGFDDHDGAAFPFIALAARP